MFGVVFSVTLSVTLSAVLFFILKGSIVRRYGFKLIYMMSLIMAVRLIIPYSIQLPGAPRVNITLPRYIPVIWLTGALLCSAYQYGKYIYMKRKIVSYSRPVREQAILDKYAAIKLEMFIDDEIPLIVSAKVSSPMLLGIIKPCIALPRVAFSESEADMVLRHELIHYRSKDSYKKLFFTAVAVIQWFNPLVWLLMREFCRSLECICDEKVTKNADVQYKRNYCYMLLKTGSQNKMPTAAVNYFSTKEMLKMRIESVFESRKKRSGTALLTVFTVSLSVLSGFLCSCTTKTPDNVKEEMSRIESGVDNEKAAADTNAERGLMPVSDVVTSAQGTIDEWNSRDGIFKFDGCEVMIPQVSEFPEYEVFFDAGLTPQKKYEQYKYMEKELFGENYFNEDELRIDPGTYMGDGYVSLEEYLKMDSPYGIIANADDEGTIENQISVNWFRLASSRNISYNEQKYIKKYNCFEMTDDELNEEWELSDGRIKVSDAIKLAEETMEKYKFSADENVNFRLKTLGVHDGGECKVISFAFQLYYKDIPFTALNMEWDSSDRIKITGMFLGTTEMTMCEVGRISSMHAGGTNLALKPTGKTYSEILSLDQVFSLIKGELSNSIVYDVEAVSLGYSGNNLSGERSVDGNVTYPIYNVVLNTGSYRLQISVDSLTGDMNICKRNVT